MADNKKTFKVEVNGKEVEVAVVRPTNKQYAQGQLVFSRTFCEAVKPAEGKKGAIVRAALEQVMREQGLWDDEKKAKLEALHDGLAKRELRLKQGGVKLSEARALALEMRGLRRDISKMLEQKHALDLVTADAQAEQARFNYWVAACTVYNNTGKPYWQSEEEYLAAQDDPVAAQAPSLLANLLYNMEDDYRTKLPENKFLVKYRFADKDLRLVNKDGHYIDEDGRRIDKDGRYVNEAGDFIDIDGNPLTKDYEYKVEEKPFLDDDGNPVLVAEDAAPDGGK